MAADNSKRNVRSLMSRIRAYERFFKEKEKSQKESIQNGQKGQKGKRAGGGTGVEGPGALDTVVLEPSNQAHTAYMSLIKLVHALDKDLAGGDTLKAEEITDEKAREVLRDIFGI